MNVINHLITFLQRDLYIFTIKDVIEILFFSIVFYALQKWLKSDSQKNLLFYFWTYSAVTLSAYYAQSILISTVLFVSAPLFLIFLIIIHQKTLQKNFVTLQKLQTPYTTFDWFNEFTKSILSMLNHQKEIIYVIERSNDIAPFIFSGCNYFAEIQKDSMDLFLEKHMGGTNSFIWITSEGKIVSINATWQLKNNDIWVTDEARTLHKWKQDAIFISQNTDAIICKVDPQNRTFDIIMQGKLVEDITPDAAIFLLKKSVFSKISNAINMHDSTKEHHQNSKKMLYKNEQF